MQTWIRVTVASALVLTGVDGQAKVFDKCIQTLEARPTRPEASSPRPCPLAIGYLPRRAPQPPARPADAAVAHRSTIADRTASADAAPDLHA